MSRGANDGRCTSDGGCPIRLRRIGFEDVVRAGEMLAAILRQGCHRDPRFAIRQAVSRAALFSSF
jgi:hypothetical protein